MTTAEVTTSLRNAGFPDDLLDAEIGEAERWVLRRLRLDYPQVGYGLFETRRSQQIYDLFNPVQDLATQQGLFPGGLRVYEVIWNASNVGSTLDVFGIAPLIQGLAFTPGTTYRSSFYTPGDWVIWDLNWSAFVKRFSPQEFEHVDSRLGSAIRLFPNPGDIQKVLFKFSRPRDEAQLREENADMFFTYVEARCAQVLALKFSFCAGTQIGPVVDMGKTLRFWQDYEKEKRADAIAQLEKHRLENLYPALRSGLP